MLPTFKADRFNNIIPKAHELLKDASEFTGLRTWYFWNCGKTCSLSLLLEKKNSVNPAENSCASIARGFRSLLMCSRAKTDGRRKDCTCASKARYEETH